MAEKSGSTTQAVDDQPSADLVPEKTGASGLPAAPEQTGTPATRPRQIAGQYPQRQMTWYHISTSDLRSIGIAQNAATICVGIGTFAIATYIDFNKDIAIAESSGQQLPRLFDVAADLLLIFGVIFWLLAVIAFLWRRSELSRIKEEHGEQTLRSKLIGRWKRNVTR